MEPFKLTRKHFSKLGLMYFLGSLIIIALQYAVVLLLNIFCPGVLNNYTLYFLIIMLSMYAVSMPLMALLIRTVPAAPAPEKKTMTVGQWIAAFLVCYAAMYAGNILGNIITAVIGALKGSAVSNTIVDIATGNYIWVNFFIMVLLAPVAEELLFRKLLIDRTAAYGEGVSVLFSALFFGLFHGNLNQFAYAFVLGGFFGFIYVKTRNIKYTIFMHMLINFIGSVLSMLVLKGSGLSDLMLTTDMSLEEMTNVISEHLSGLLIFFIYCILLLAVVIAGIVLFFVNLKKIRFAATEQSVPKGKRFAAYVVNAGVLLFIIFWIVQIILQLLS